MSSKARSKQGPWQIKRINSSTGTKGSKMSAAMRNQISVKDQTEILWSFNSTASAGVNDGWEYDTSYRFNIVHQPDQNLIKLKLWENGTMIIDTGDIIDNSPNSLKGGRLGVYCESQENILWSALNYRYFYI